MKKVFKRAFDDAVVSLEASQSAEVVEQVEHDENRSQQSEEVNIEQAFEGSAVKFTTLQLQHGVLKALEVLPEELAQSLKNKANRFFKKPESYQAEHLDAFVDGLAKIIDNYIAPPSAIEVRSEEQPDVVLRHDYREIKNDVLANIALALASLIIFYPLVLAITSKVQGREYGFYRFNDGRNDSYEELPSNLESARSELKKLKTAPEEESQEERFDETVDNSL